ncbi:MAG: hypothetical protein SGBAC_008315 [Bacillariaceae sp.]
MRIPKHSLLCLPLLALLLNGARAADASNDDKKPNVRRLGSSLSKTKSEYKSKPTKTIKGADDRQLFFLENPPVRKTQPAVSKYNYRLAHEAAWKQQFLPTASPSTSGSPSALPSTPPSESPSTSPSVAPIRVACAGDSLTRGTSGVRNGVSYPHQLQGLLGGGFETRNYGRNAMTAIADLDVSYIKTSQYRDSLAFDADIYLLMLGTNDSLHWGPHSHKFQAGLKFIIDQVRNTSPGVRIILAIPPWAKTNTYGIENNILANDIHPKIRQVALAQQVELVDMYTATSNRSYLYTIDNLHLNAEGYRTLAEVWEKQILCNKNGMCDIGESCETCREDCLDQCGGRKTEKEFRNDVSP